MPPRTFPRQSVPAAELTLVPDLVTVLPTRERSSGPTLLKVLGPGPTRVGSNKVLTETEPETDRPGLGRVGSRVGFWTDQIPLLIARRPLYLSARSRSSCIMLNLQHRDNHFRIQEGNNVHGGSTLRNSDLIARGIK